MKANISVYQWLSVGLLTACVGIVSYCIARTDTFLLFALYAVAFGLFIFLSKQSIGSFFLWGLIPRVLLFAAIPNLSEDYFRFLWDGLLSLNGISPFGVTPAEIMASQVTSPGGEFQKELYDGMNSAPYFSVYPPLNQWLFMLAASFSNLFVGVLLLKAVLLTAEIGIYFLIKKLLERFRLPSNRILLYWLNPLVILEVMGNLHFEALMLFFFLLSAWNYARVKDLDGVFAFGFSALSKLFSLMMLPLMMLKLSGKRALKSIGLILVLIILCYWPFIDKGIFTEPLTSLSVYFIQFEFNAGLYYLVREISTEVMGYNAISVVGPLMAICSFLVILLISLIYRFRNRLSLFTGFLLIFTCYLIFTPVVHPWYLIVPVALSIFTHYRYPIWWSGLVFLSYHAYGNENFTEEPFVLLIEYTVVAVVFLWEVRRRFSFSKLKASLSMA